MGSSYRLIGVDRQNLDRSMSMGPVLQIELESKLLDTS